MTSTTRPARTATTIAPATDVLTANILAAWDECTDDDRTSGRDWYASARELAATLDPADPVRGAAVIAVLSPLLSWPMNVRGATDVYSHRPFRGMTKNGLKAEALRDGGDIDTYVRGSKVRSFFLNISDPSAADAVTVDRHAVDVALGRVTDDATRGAILGRKSEYARVRDSYLAAAAIISDRTGQHWAGSQVQAVVWVMWRKRHALANHG